jgi:hypothetical protein
MFCRRAGFDRRIEAKSAPFSKWATIETDILGRSKLYFKA